MADPDRKGGGGLSLRTLAIASASSLTAAMVTSRLFPPGTVYASALTPVIVAAVGELLHRPANRVAELREQRRTMVLESRRMETVPMSIERDPLREPDRPREPDPLREPATGELRVHGRRRRLHPRVWIATGVAAFAIAAAALTLPELIFGGAVATEHRTTLFGGGTSKPDQGEEPAPATTAPDQAPETVTETVPAQTPSQATDTTTTDTTTPTEPSGGATAPSETSTDTGTSTAPGGVLPPIP